MNRITVRNKVKDLLNTECLDPYPGTRTGNQFLDETDEINLNRPKTFPKGYLFIDEKETDHSNFYKSGWESIKTTINIHYFAKSLISYNDGTTTYKDRDYCNFMAEKIEDTLKNNKLLGDGVVIETINPQDPPRELINEKVMWKIYEVVVPVVVKWKNKYG